MEQDSIAWKMPFAQEGLKCGIPSGHGSAYGRRRGACRGQSCGIYPKNGKAEKQKKAGRLSEGPAAKACGRQGGCQEVAERLSGGVIVRGSLLCACDRRSGGVSGVYSGRFPFLSARHIRALARMGAGLSCRHPLCKRLPRPPRHQSFLSGFFRQFLLAVPVPHVPQAPSRPSPCLSRPSPPGI